MSPEQEQELLERVIRIDERTAGLPELQRTVARHDTSITALETGVRIGKWLIGAVVSVFGLLLGLK